MQNRKKKQPKKANSFVIENKIEQAPTSCNTIKRKNGYKIVSRGVDNLLPLTISNIVKGSATLSNVIYSKAEFISSGEITTDTKVEQQLNNDLNKDYDFYELLKRTAIDYNTHGYTFLEVVRLGKEKFIYHLPTEEVCIEEYDIKPELALISKDWTKYNLKPTEIAFYPNETKDEDAQVETYRSIIMISDYGVTSGVYAFPKWVACYYDAQVESLIGQYNANQFENGITLSSILSIDLGELSGDEDEDKKKLSKFKKELQGTSGGRSGKTLVHMANSGVEAPSYLTFPMEKEGSFAKLQETTENNIVKANQWFRSLAGIATAGTLGNTQQLKNEWALAERQIKNFQYKVTDLVFMALEITSEYAFNNQTPIDLVGDYAVIKDVLMAKETIGVNATIEMLKLLGVESEQAEKMANDSE